MSANTSRVKALRDLWENKARALLVLLALIVGVVGVGTVAVTYSILPREMDRNYLGTEPASATLYMDGVDEGLVKEAAAAPGIAAAEARSEIVGRFKVGPGEWRELWLYVVPDFNGMRMDLFTHEGGAWPPAAGEILLERTAVGVAGASMGERVTVKIPNAQERTLSFTGTVHAPSLPPAWVESRVYGYITPETLSLFGVPPALNQLKILAAGDRMDESAVRSAAYALKDRLERSGRSVSRIDIPKPGKHVHADLMEAFIAILGAMGILALLMSGVLVTNMISAMVNAQVRQIGIMKAIGGGAGRIAGIYLSMVLALGLLALAAGLPASLALGRALAGFEAVQMLNFQIFDFGVAPWVYGLVIAVGLLIPLLSAAVPIARGSRVTVLAALSDYGTGKGPSGSGRIDVFLSRLKGGARSFLLSMRNVFRRRTRLILTLLTLTAAGASFITAVNTRVSVDRAVAKKFAATPFDIEVAFSRSYPQADVERVAASIRGVRRVETWSGAVSSVVLRDGTLGKRLRLTAPLLGTELTPAPPVIAGRWLRPGDRNAIVMSDAMMRKAGITAGVGGEILLDVQGRRAAWRIVGVTREFLAGTAYVPSIFFDGAAGQIALSTNIVVKAEDPALTDGISRELESGLSAAGFDVYTLWKTSDSRKVVEDHMVLITGILFVMAALFVAVGGLGLASTMSLNVLDRTRELGVMRAIGAAPAGILRVIVTEGALIGVLGWVFSIALSVPYTVLMGEVIAMFLESPLDLATSVGGWLLWLLISMAIGSAASVFPAWVASRRPVHAALSYE